MVQMPALGMKGHQNVDTRTNVISLYSGGGGLDLGFRMAVPNARTVCYVEREVSAVALLVDHMQTGQLDDAPVWTDSGTFDGEPWRGVVDFIIGGFPCQPFSVAGKQLGTDDERWLWPHIERLVREIRPRGIFLENVPGLFHGGIEHVLGDLAALGYDAEWISVRASDVGAPHRRERVFILGNSRGTRSQIGEVHTGQVTGQGSAPVANTGSVLGQDPQPGRTQGRESSDAAGANGELGITSSSGLSTGRHREREHQVRDNGNGSPSEDQQQRGVGQSGTSEGSEALGDTGSERLEGPHDYRESSEGLQPHTSQRRSYLADTDSTRSTTRIHRRGIDSEGRQEQARYVGDNGSEVVNAYGIGRRTQGDSEQQSTRAGWGCRPLQWPPSPKSTEDWREVIEVRPDLAPAVKPEVRDLADGLAGKSYILDSVVQQIKDCNCDCHQPLDEPKDGPESLPETTAVRTVRVGESSAETSRRSSETSGNQVPVPEVPLSATQGIGFGEICRICELPNLRNGIHAASDTKFYAVWGQELPIRNGQQVSPETVEWSEQNEIVRAVWQGICIYEGTGTDLQQKLRNQIGLATSDLSRTDQLRILGNGVVPAQAALAFLVLEERLE